MQMLSCLSKQTTTIVEDVIPMWASSTWKTNSSLLQRLRLHVAAHPQLSPLPMSLQVADFLASMKGRVQESTRHSYGKTLRAMARRVGATTAVLDLQLKGIAASATTRTPKQAPPCSFANLHTIFERAWRESELPNSQLRRLPLILYVVWKTASRWGDLQQLTKKSFLTQGTAPAEIVVEWGSGTKTTRFQPYIPSGWTMINEEKHPMMMQQLKNELRKMKKGEKFCTISTERIRRWLRADPATARLTAHSFKRGALQVLVDHAVAGELDPRLIPLIAKHKDDLHGFPSSTLRYVASKVSLAKMLGSGKATRLL